MITEYSRPELNESMSENYSIVETVTSGDGSVDANKEELKDQMNSMMEKVTHGGRKWKCTICGKTTHGSSTQIRRRIETHMEGLYFSCNFCETVKQSSNALNIHISTTHRK